MISEFIGIIPRQAVYCKLSFISCLFHIFVFYAPIRVTKKDKCKYYALLGAWFSEMNQSYWLGILTAPLTPSLIDPRGRNITRRRQKNLTEIIQRFELSDVYRHINPTLKVFTWRNKSGSASRIDRIYISDFMLTHIKSFFTTPFSDHCSITANIKVGITRSS